MSKILLSIKPEYAYKILNGTKKYEYRKRLPQKSIDKIVIYSTAPDSMLIGEVKVCGALVESPTAIWEKTKQNAGISREKYRKYFKGCKTAVAFCLYSPTIYNKKKRLEEIGIDFCPQSFVYLEDNDD